MQRQLQDQNLRAIDISSLMPNFYLSSIPLDANLRPLLERILSATKGLTKPGCCLISNSELSVLSGGDLNYVEERLYQCLSRLFSDDPRELTPLKRDEKLIIVMANIFKLVDNNPAFPRTKPGPYCHEIIIQLW